MKYLIILLVLLSGCTSRSDQYTKNSCWHDESTDVWFEVITPGKFGVIIRHFFHSQEYYVTYHTLELHNVEPIDCVWREEGKS